LGLTSTTRAGTAGLARLFIWHLSKCFLAFEPSENRRPHTSHLYGFSPVWRRMCEAKLLAYGDWYTQIEQKYVQQPVDEFLPRYPPNPYLVASTVWLNTDLAKRGTRSEFGKLVAKCSGRAGAAVYCSRRKQACFKETKLSDSSGCTRAEANPNKVSSKMPTRIVTNTLRGPSTIDGMNQGCQIESVSIRFDFRFTRCRNHSIRFRFDIDSIQIQFDSIENLVSSYEKIIAIVKLANHQGGSTTTSEITGKIIYDHFFFKFSPFLSHISFFLLQIGV
jgi:hypothetical protein